VSGASVVLAQQLDDVDTAREHITHVCAGGP
jgi:hypothetical protein